MAPRLFLFDIDGTILLIRGAGMKAIKKTMQNLFNLSPVSVNICPDGKTDPLIIKSVMEHNHIPVENYKAMQRKILERYLFYLKQTVAQARTAHLLPGIPGIIESLRKIPGSYVGLATGNFKDAAFVKLGRFGIGNLFQVGGFADISDVRYEIIQNAIVKSEIFYNIKLDPENIFVVGDTPFDVMAAKEKNVKSIGVATGRFKKRELTSAGCDIFMENLGNQEKFFKAVNLIEK